MRLLYVSTRMRLMFTGMNMPGTDWRIYIKSKSSFSKKLVLIHEGLQLCQVSMP